jgi:glycosyltransferase involved in cell wall biosynthesis
MPRCSIIIRAFNEEAHIGRLLEGIAKQAEQDVEVILVDSGSTDATVGIARRYPVKVVSITPKSFTFGYALNQGIAASSGEFIVIASAHVYPVFPDWLERMLAPFSDPKIALTYGKQRSVSYFSEKQIWEQWFPDESNPRQEHPFCNNANAAIRRRLWEQQPYDEALTGLEDLAWAEWAIRQEYLLAYVAEAEIIHIHSETKRKVYRRYNREAIAFKRIFPDERFNLWDFLRLSISNISSDLWHAARQRVLWAHAVSIVWFRVLQFWGTYQGYRFAGPITRQVIRRFYYPRSLRQGRQDDRPVEPIMYNEPQISEEETQ